MNLDPKDAAALIRQTRSDNTILVGGQAVAFWIDYFGIKPRLAALTADIDYLGTRREAQRVHNRLTFPHELKIATPEDLPNTALLSVRLKGYEEPILIDYLATVIGLESKEIASSAVTVRVDGENLKVIHPIPLMKSKIWNVYQLQVKRTPEGIEQARLSIEIVAAYLTTGKLTRRDLLKAIETIGRFAATQPARYVRNRHSLECLDAIPSRLIDGNELPDAFREKRWPRILAATR